MGARQDKLLNRSGQVFDKSEFERPARKPNKADEMKYYA